MLAEAYQGLRTSFSAQTDDARQLRLRKAKEDYQLEDEHRGGHLANTLLELQREDKNTKRIGSADPSKKAAKPDSHDVTVVPSGDAEVSIRPEVARVAAAAMC